MIEVTSAAIAVIEGLEADQVSHMLVGAYSSSAYSIPRGTKDVDVIISLQTEQSPDRVMKRLEAILGEAYCCFALHSSITFVSPSRMLCHALSGESQSRTGVF